MIQQGDMVTFQTTEGQTIKGRIKNIYKNICASIEESNKESHIVSLSALKKMPTPKLHDVVRFSHNNKWQQGVVKTIEHNIALVEGKDFGMYVLLSDLTVI